MKILLVGVDFDKVNIALGKLSTYHKSLGDDATLVHAGLSGYPSKKKVTIDADEYDKVYVSQLFDTNQGRIRVINCKNIEVGGVGSRYPKKKLAKEIDDLDIDYSIFDTDTSYDFITRGCINKCYFCKVWQTEGKIKFYRELNRIIKHDKVKFLDNNFLAYDGHIEILKELVKLQTKFQFNQGLDIRLITETDCKLLKRCNLLSGLLFAFDNINDKGVIASKLKIVKRYFGKPFTLKFYVYHNAKITNISDTIDRVEWLRSNKCVPYIMRDVNCYESEDKDFLVDYSGYCNQPGIFKNMTFKQFLMKRHPKNKQRRISSFEIYRDNS